MKLYLGPAGIGSPALEGLEIIKKADLNAAEVEFVRQVYMTNDLAKKVGEKSKELNIRLSVHAPYYINLNSEDNKKIQDSKRRILKSCERAHYLNAKYVVFHPGYYGKKDKEETYKIIKKHILDLKKEIKREGWKVKLAPETTGKRNVFGSIEEILRLVKETGCSFCIDFAHIKAREEKINYKEVFDKIKKFKEIHSHFSGIEFTEKGEKRHLITKESEIRELIKEILKRKIDITIINESPDSLGDSIKTKKIAEDYNRDKHT